MNKKSSFEYTGHSNTGIEDAVNKALNQVTNHFDRYEIMETCCSKAYSSRQDKTYQVTLKMVCEC